MLRLLTGLVRGVRKRQAGVILVITVGLLHGLGTSGYCITCANKNGVNQTTYKNGQVDEIVHCQNGKKHGPYKSFHKNGYLRSTGQYANGKKTGQWSEYSEKDQNEMTRDATYMDGRVQGVLVNYFTSTYVNGMCGGQLSKKVERYYYGVIHGKSTQWGCPWQRKDGGAYLSRIDHYECGRVVGTTTFKDGKPQFKNKLTESKEHPCSNVRKRQDMVTGGYQGFTPEKLAEYEAHTLRAKTIQQQKK